MVPDIEPYVVVISCICKLDRSLSPINELLVITMGCEPLLHPLGYHAMLVIDVVHKHRN